MKAEPHAIMATANLAAMDVAEETTFLGSRNAQRLAVWELISVMMTVLIIEWVVIPFAGRRSLLVFVPLASYVVLFVASALLRSESLREVGFRFDNFYPAARLLILPMMAGAVLLAALGWWLQAANFGEPRGGRFLWRIMLWSLVWSLAQQYVLQAYVNRRAQIVFGRGARSIFIVASIFALLHIPNLPLTAATFLGGIIWAYVYQRAPNIPALAFSHAVMSWVLISTVPAPLLNGMRAGYNYFL